MRGTPRRRPTWHQDNGGRRIFVMEAFAWVSLLVLALLAIVALIAGVVAV